MSSGDFSLNMIQFSRLSFRSAPASSCPWSIVPLPLKAGRSRTYDDYRRNHRTLSIRSSRLTGQSLVRSSVLRLNQSCAVVSTSNVPSNRSSRDRSQERSRGDREFREPLSVRATDLKNLPSFIMFASNPACSRAKARFQRECLT